jgi:glycosyltransferase involved in cell wall biosynthesis
VQRRILLLITDLEIGGTPTVVRELAVRLRHATGAHIEVAGLSDPGPLCDQLIAQGIECTPLGAHSTMDLKIIPKLHRLLRRQKIDTVVSFLIHANALAAAMRLLYPRARYFQSVQTTQPHPVWHWALERIVHHAALRIIAPSSSVADAARFWSGVPASKISIIPNAIDPAGYRSTGHQPVMSEHGLVAHATINIGFIGRLDPIKRLPDLLQATANLPTNIHLHIFGEGRERNRIETIIERLRLASRVTLHGVIARPQEALAQIELLVLPSDAEGFGLVLIEAMAANIPVVATNVPGIRDVVIDNQTGLLVAPRAPEQLARAIARLLGDTELKKRLVENAAADVRRRFTWEVVLPQYRQLLGL